MELTLVNKKQETLNVTSYVFTPPSPILWTPGQFMIYSLKHPNSDNRGIMRFFTISSAPFENQITITTKINNENSSSFKIALNNLKIGDKIEAKGPDGDFTLNDPFAEYVFIAGGIGITPFRAIVADLSHDKSPIKITLLYANRDEDIAFKNELDQLAKTNLNFRVNYFISPNHIDENAIKNVISDFKKPIYFISGPNKMVEELSNLLTTLGAEKKKIKLDYFNGYEAI